MMFVTFWCDQMEKGSLAVDCKTDGVSRKAPPPQGLLISVPSEIESGLFIEFEFVNW